ncbi:uncharacterized protein LOC141637960 [Silene latifolia]|uniref:uncharacterized protein LOC141637960 n=1 Tax=Silene latifolia TaxID=37657 RepID=UPI003D78A6D5
MSHQLRQLTSNNKRISEITESSFSSSQRSFKLQSQGVNNLQLLNHTPTPTPTPTPPPTTKTTVEPFSRRVVDVYCTCFGTWPKKFGINKNKQISFDSTSPMATTAANEQLRGPLDMGKKNYGGQRIREELQREVSVLERMLSHEEKIREIMQQAYNRKPGMEFTLPNYLPPKMKEVLSELVMVEDEIARLETQIQKIQNDTKSEHEATQKLATKQLATISKLRNASTSKPNPHDETNDQLEQLPSYDNKALHFISKAINGGGYSLNDFTISNHKIGTQSSTSTLGNSSSTLENRKESGINDRVIIAKSSGMLKPSASPMREFRHPPASPLRDFRHPTPKPQERSSTEFRADQARKALPGQTKMEEMSSGTKWQPNKLSENIMKTIILLYVRLIRTSRQSEIEKSGPVSRSLNYTAVSFRKEAGVNLSTSLVLNKESKQQDPYGVFDIEGAVRRDIGPYKNLVVFSSSSLEPKFVSHPSSISLFQKLRGLLSSLQKVDLRSLTEQHKLAFWMNIYNACIMHGYLKFGVPTSPDKLINLLNKATLNVGGKIVNAQAIERCILRKPTQSTTKQVEMDTKEAIIHEQYGLKSVNSNVIFGLCYGTRSSPAVRIYTAEGVTSELEKSKLEYLLASISVTSSKKIWLPELLIENMVDFANDMDSLVHWVCQQLPTSGSLRKSIVDCFRGVASNSGRILSQPANNVETLSFQFEFQYLLQV